MAELSAQSREIVEAGVSDGLYATPVRYRFLPTAALSSPRWTWRAPHLGVGTLLGGRTVELLRIRSAQLGECEPCSQSRKHDSITDDDVACLLTPAHGTLSRRKNRSPSNSST